MYINNEMRDLLKVYSEVSEREIMAVPLCAAENITSEFAKIPLTSFLQEKYIMGGILQYNSADNFIGSDKLYNIYEIFSRQCKKLFGYNYTDARTLSGVNAATIVMMSLFAGGDTIYMTDSSCGGHTSMPELCKRLGIKIEFLPYDFAAGDFDYQIINKKLKEQSIKGFFFALSDIIRHPDLRNINLDGQIIIYDATQTLGLIAGDIIDNPLSTFDKNSKVMLIGATHKTMPGPTCGLIMTNCTELAQKLDRKINPDYLRNVQFNNILSTLFVLFELEYFGKDYGEKTIENGNILGKYLSEYGFEVLKAEDNIYTKTHQLWLSFDDKEDLLDAFTKQAAYYNITLNDRKRRIYKNMGIRLGLQQVSRYNWGSEEMHVIAEALNAIRIYPTKKRKIQNLILQLPNKTVHYTFDNVIYKKFQNTFLHNG